jgi:hypothetical protein
MPFADLSKFEKDPQVMRIGELFTVDLITRYIEIKFQEAAGNPQPARA